MNKRNAILTICTLTVALLASGCSWFRVSSAQQKIALASTIAYEAAFIGAAIDLKDNPARRPSYEVAQAFLENFLASGSNEDLAIAMQKLPVNELQGENGAIIVSGIVTIYDLAKNTFIDVANTPPWIAGVGGAINRGLRDALAISPSAAQKLSSKKAGFVTPQR